MISLQFFVVLGAGVRCERYIIYLLSDTTFKNDFIQAAFTRSNILRQISNLDACDEVYSNTKQYGCSMQANKKIHHNLSYKRNKRRNLPNEIWSCKSSHMNDIYLFIIYLLLYVHEFSRHIYIGRRQQGYNTLAKVTHHN